MPKPALQQKTIDSLLNHSYLWRASHGCQHNRHQNSIHTGFQALDQQLACGGWPLGQFIECLLPNAADQGIAQLPGLLHIFLPAIQTIACHKEQNPSPILLINPPCRPHLPGWFEQLEPHEQTGPPLWVVQTHGIEEQLWATEYALTSNACSVVMSWLSRSSLPASALRKLQLAARRSQSLFIGIRDARQQATASPAPLRIALQPTVPAAGIGNRHNRPYTQLAVHIVKQPGRWGGQVIPVSWHSQLQQAAAPATQWPVHYPQQAVPTTGTCSSANKQRLHRKTPGTHKYS